MSNPYEFRDYTLLKNHQVRVWKLSDQVDLKLFGGLVARVAGIAIAIASAVGFIVFVVASIIGLPSPVVFALIVGGSFGTWFYRRATSESAKTDPITALKKIIRRITAPRRYAGAVTAETKATKIHWQVILWRPHDNTAEIGAIRQFNSYNPQPVGYDERREDPPGYADILVGYRDPFNPQKFVEYDYPD